MPVNVEVKARVGDPSRVISTLDAIGAQRTESLRQEDTFFAVQRGRLKMRCDDHGHCELVYYRREDEPGPSVSSYYRRALEDAERSKKELGKLFGIKGVVRKDRQVFVAEGARIHFDEVEGLGRFLEIEVPLNEARDAHLAKHLARRLMRVLAIQDRDLVAEAYEDLFAKRRKRGSLK